MSDLIIKLKLAEKQERFEKQYSKHKHISFSKRRKRWVVQVYITRSMNKYIGSFLTENEAITALNKYLEQTSPCMARNAGV